MCIKLAFSLLVYAPHTKIKQNGANPVDVSLSKNNNHFDMLKHTSNLLFLIHSFQKNHRQQQKKQKQQLFKNEAETNTQDL